MIALSEETGLCNVLKDSIAMVPDIQQPYQPLLHILYPLGEQT